MSIPERSLIIIIHLSLALIIGGCALVQTIPGAGPDSKSLPTQLSETPDPPLTTNTPSVEGLPANQPSTSRPETVIPTHTPAPTGTSAPNPTAVEPTFDVGIEITIPYLREVEIPGSVLTLHEELSPGSNYERHLVSYISEGNRIYGLLTIPLQDPPEDGYKAIIFNHGYIPPWEYKTTQRYQGHVDFLARNGFVVFKIDYRGHGKSEGEPVGTYLSPGYTIDAINALKTLQRLAIVDPQGIGMWGHSMAGNLILRAMLLEPDIQAGVIWAGAVYSYQDFVKYGINDNSYRPPPTPEGEEGEDHRNPSRKIFETYGRPDIGVDFWQAVSLTEHIEHLNSPLQIHHAEDDPVVRIDYSWDLVQVLKDNNKEYEFYTYEGGGHNLNSPYFDQAMLRSVQFFKDNL